MAYLVSQIRRTSGGQGTYMTSIASNQVTIGSDLSPNYFQTDTKFYDFAIQTTFTAGKVYYFRCQILKVPEFYYKGVEKSSLGMQPDPDSLSITVLLKNTGNNEEKHPPEVISTFRVPVQKMENGEQNNEYFPYDVVFSPSTNFNCLVLRINRISYDVIYLDHNPNTLEDGKPIPIRNWLINNNTNSVDRWKSNDDTETSSIIPGSPRIKCIGVEGYDSDWDLAELNNLVTTTGAVGWLKMGYQSRPGNLIVVNKEPIRVGRSGIYELNNGTLITDFMIAAPNGTDNNNIDPFLLDYAYLGS